MLPFPQVGFDPGISSRANFIDMPFLLTWISHIAVSHKECRTYAIGGALTPACAATIYNLHGLSVRCVLIQGGPSIF